MCLCKPISGAAFLRASEAVVGSRSRSIGALWGDLSKDSACSVASRRRPYSAGLRFPLVHCRFRSAPLIVAFMASFHVQSTHE